LSLASCQLLYPANIVYNICQNKAIATAFLSAETKKQNHPKILGWFGFRVSGAKTSGASFWKQPFSSLRLSFS